MYREDRKFNSRSLYTHEKDETKEKPLPPYLYYGTGPDFFPPRDGDDIYPECGNTHVHLYDSILPAICLGSQRGGPFIYRVNSGKMAEDGYVFHYSEGMTWMTEKVPAEYYERTK